MKPTIPLRKTLADKQLLGRVLAGDTWRAWRILLIASMGEALRDDERALFTELTGRTAEPSQRVEELCAVIGRRGGKSRALSTLAAYIAGLCDHDLVLGETGVVLLIAPDQRQAAISLDYCTAAFEQSPILKQLIASRTADTLRLNNGISIEVRSASFRRLRGPTFVAVLVDECAFFYTEEFSSNADTEILNAVRPGLSTTSGPLIIASSPYAKRGVLWETHRKHFGPSGDPLILVAQGASRTFNPSLKESIIDRALARDRTAATAEYLAQFRSDIETFVPYEVVVACVGDHVEASPLTDNQPYFVFVDPSGGSADSFTLAISHRNGERVVIDAIREVQPPFSPEQVIDDLATLIRSYGIARVVGERYAGEFPREQFRKRGIHYVCAEKPKSDLFRDLLPLLNSGRIVLPKSDRLVNQLTGLERRTSRAGKDSIDHSPGSHDDLANAVAGAASLALLADRNRLPTPVQSYYTRSKRAQSSMRQRIEDEMRQAVPMCTIDFSLPKNQWRFTDD
jgi:hypothetical protein